MTPDDAARATGTPETFHCYPPIPDEVFHGGIYVTSVGRGAIGPGEAYPPVRHPALYHFDWSQGRVLPEFSLMLVSAGRGVFESRATGRVAVRAGTALLLFPDVWHRYAPERETGWTETWVHFNGEFAHRLLEEGVIAPERAVIPLPDPAPVGLAFARLIDQVRAAPAANSLLVSLLAMGALAAAIDPGGGQGPDFARGQASSIKKTDTDLLVAAARDYIWTRSHKILTVPAVVEALGVERRTLERRFAARTGHTVLAEIVRCRFRRAERLLSETDLPIKTVVSLAGFGSAENLRQVFVKETGLSAAAYRKRQQAGRRG